MKPNKDIQLVKTDYDDFKDLTFFIKQQKKANEMLREVRDFQKSFILSKFISFREFVEQNPTYGLDLFDDTLWITYYQELPDKMPRDFTEVFHNPDFNSYGCLYVPVRLPIVYSKEERVFGYETRQVEMTDEEERILNDFYFSIFNHFQLPHATRSSHKIWYYKPSKGWNYETLEQYPENKTTLILDCRKYITDKDLNYYIFEYYNGQRVRDYRFVVDEKFSTDNNYWDILYECQDIIRHRFSEALDVYTQLYMRDTEENVLRMWNEDFGSPNEKRIIVWNGEPKFVSVHPDNYTAVVSDDEQSITFGFEHGASFNIHGETHNLHRQRSWTGCVCPPDKCWLTYSTKNNELINYQEY